MIFFQLFFGEGGKLGSFSLMPLSTVIHFFFFFNQPTGIAIKLGWGGVKI